MTAIFGEGQNDYEIIITIAIVVVLSLQMFTEYALMNGQRRGLPYYVTLRWRNKAMIRKQKYKYLHELFPGGLPFPYGEKNYHKFDERDTFNLDNTLVMYLYECLRYFQDVASQTIVMDDPTWRTFEVDGERLTKLQCIDRMVDDCKTILLYKEWEDEHDLEWPKIDAAKDDLFKVLSKVYWAMWW